MLINKFDDLFPKKTGFLNLNYLYRLGHLSLGWLAGILSGMITIVGVEMWLRFSGSYDSYADGSMPSYANAMVNLTTRIPIFILGTIILTGFFFYIADPHRSSKRFLLEIFNMVFYWFLIFLGIFIFPTYGSLDTVFVGSFALILFPCLVAIALSFLNPFRLEIKEEFTRRDSVWTITGLLTAVTPLLYLVVHYFFSFMIDFII